MKIAAAYALANLIGDNELRPDYIIPAAFDPRVKDAVAAATAEAARKSGVSRIGIKRDKKVEGGAGSLFLTPNSSLLIAHC